VIVNIQFFAHFIRNIVWTQEVKTDFAEKSNQVKLYRRHDFFSQKNVLSNFIKEVTTRNTRDRVSMRRICERVIDSVLKAAEKIKREWNWDGRAKYNSNKGFDERNVDCDTCQSRKKLCWIHSRNNST